MRRALLLAVTALCLLAPAAQAQSARIYTQARPITPGTPVAPGYGIALACSAAGNERLVMSNGSFLDVYAQQGTAIIDNLSVKDVNAAATTAACTVTVLDF